MKGLLLKDYYLIRSGLRTTFIGVVIIGVGMAILTSAWSLIINLTLFLGIISLTTINIDKTSGWQKVSDILPISKRTVISSKYVLYFLLSAAGLILGIIPSILFYVFINHADYNNLILVISISLAVSLISGSITIPCSFLLREEKSNIILIITYTLLVLILIVTTVLFNNKIIVCGCLALIGLIFYNISWIFSKKFIGNKIYIKVNNNTLFKVEAEKFE